MINYTETQQYQQNPQVFDVRNYTYPDQIRDISQQIISTIKAILEIPKSISTLRRVLRGEALIENEDGTTEWVQVVKPRFVKLDPLTRQPIKKTIVLKNGEIREIYEVNDEAVEEILSMLYFMGMNPITPLTNLSEDNILDDLKEFEIKLASVLTLKQIEWGMDKELMPVYMITIKTPVQDARYMCANGVTMKALTQQVSRIEQVVEDIRKKPNPIY